MLSNVTGLCIRTLVSLVSFDSFGFAIAIYGKNEEHNLLSNANADSAGFSCSY